MDLHRLTGIAMLVTALAAAPAVVGADDEGHGSTESEPGVAIRGHDHEIEHGRAHNNELALFLGATDEHGHDAEFTWGADYKRRVAERWAVGVLFDYAGGELRNYVVAPMVAYWPGLGNLQLLAAPGIEYHDGRGGDAQLEADPGHHDIDEDHTYFLFRLGLGYDIHLGERFGVVPNVNLDFVNGEEVWVYGLAFTYGF
jgi:hypothetical protein